MGGLGDADHVADADLLRRTRELEPAGTAAARGDEAAANQDRHDLRHVEFGDAVLSRDIGSLDVLAAGERAVNENAERVAGLLGQSHRDYPGETIPDRNRANSVNLEACTSLWGIAMRRILASRLWFKPAPQNREANLGFLSDPI